PADADGLHRPSGTFHGPGPPRRRVPRRGVPRRGRKRSRPPRSAGRLAAVGDVVRARHRRCPRHREALRRVAAAGEHQRALMIWLTVAGGAFLVWLVLVFLFTPGINYHLSRRASVHDDKFLYILQTTCQ